MKFDQVRSVLEAFNIEGVEYVLVGSMAMAAHGLVRATEDIDFFVATDLSNVERVRKALRETFADDSVAEITSDDLSGPYPVIRYGPPESELVIDLIGRLGDAYSFADIEHEIVNIDGLDVPVATPRMLYEMKRDTVRPQDRVDAQRLSEKFGMDRDS